MPTQIAKLDFWNYLNYKNSNQLISNASEISNFVEKQSSGFLSVSGTLGIQTRYSSPLSHSNGGETLYLSDSEYKSVYFIPAGGGSGLSVSTAGITEINNNSGFELHYTDYYREPLATTGNIAMRFSVDGVNYGIQWSSTDLRLFVIGTSTQLFTLSSTVGASTAFSQMRFRAFCSGGFLYVQANGNQGVNNPFGHYSVAVTDTDFSNIRTTAWTDNRINNLSLYTISSAEATTYAAAVDENNLAPFQRYAPMLDLVPVFGDTWETDDVANPWTALTDGDLTTAAYTKQKGKPIGFIASDGTQNTITSGEWYMVATGGVGLDFSTVGGQAVGTLHNVFLATAGATIGTDSVYQLLTFGDIYSRCYSWTPGTLTQLPTIGLIRNGGSMGFSIANSEAEDITYYFGMFDNVAAGGANVSTYKYISTDIATSGNPFGETLAATRFSEDGIFNGHQFATWQPVIFALERKPD